MTRIAWAEGASGKVKQMRSRRLEEAVQATRGKPLQPRARGRAIRTPGYPRDPPTYVGGYGGRYLLQACPRSLVCYFAQDEHAAYQLES